MSEHPRSRVAGWILLALAGLAVAVALSVAASNLSTQPIGLSAEPLRAGEKLAPASVTRMTQTGTSATNAKKDKQATTRASTGATPPRTGTSTTEPHEGRTERRHDRDD